MSRKRRRVPAFIQLFLAVCLAVGLALPLAAGTTAAGPYTCDAPVRIMPLGDSITYGTYGNSVDTRPPEEVTGYRQPLYLNLVAAGHYVDFVGEFQNGQNATPAFDADHQGIKGIKADEVADQVYDWLQANPADVVLLHIGTNDIAFADPVMQVIADVTFLLDEIDRYEVDSGSHVTVVLARIINRTDNTTKQQATTNYNLKLQELADDRVADGDDIIVVDHEPALIYTIGVDMSDTLHPNDSGYAKMATVWQEQALDDLLPICPIAITKSAAPLALFGSPVTFTIRVSNTTSVVNLSGVSVSDPAVPACNRSIGALAAGASTTYTCTKSNVTADLTNTATVTGMADTMPSVPVSDTDSVSVGVIHPNIQVTLTANTTTIEAGRSVSYTYEVRNVGDDPLNNVTVTDSVCTPVAGPSIMSGNGDNRLDPGELWKYTCSFKPASSVTSIATASGVHSLGGMVSGTDSVDVKVESFLFFPLIGR